MSKVNDAINFAVEKVCSILNFKPEVTSQMKTSVMEAYKDSLLPPPKPEPEAEEDLESDVNTHRTTGGMDEDKDASGFGGFANGAR